MLSAEGYQGRNAIWSTPKNVVNRSFSYAPPPHIGAVVSTVHHADEHNADEQQKGNQPR
jgi:hypothetical protein